MHTALYALVAAAAVLPAAAMSQDTPSGLKDLVGARAGQSEGELGRRGYVLVRTQTDDDRKWTFWFNAAYGRCVSIATIEGRYQSIVETPVVDCQGGNQQQSSANVGNQQPPAYAGNSPQTGQQQGARYTVDGRPVDLGLVCFGEGHRPAIANRSEWVWNSDRDRYDYGTRSELTSESVDATVTLQLWENGGRIRLPKELVPIIHSGANDGWWALNDVVAMPDVITASYRLNGLNKPKVSMDRRSGRISIRGVSPYEFTGQCDVIDGEDHRRF
ncbi:hypothetical protein [Polymorphobacter fuscus]|uniref:Uncharacterized protein n=1 Tax=Sandarakinorhabdus fusca TaxID=1439888 RepID=A0A7C9GXJ6_9SPHN|nr:hypothetical protein [Polymorphobacter fuscus]KAB7646136.1 hypothetical protein F9290_08670 [Polymorphobacter fuscus]MQT17334.1 hypothetical protein [Polymorphobacter fuscus]NJC10133.1 hypothetical protein [Polymorphobacter fuscus]